MIHSNQQFAFGAAIAKVNANMKLATDKRPAPQSLMGLVAQTETGYTVVKAVSVDTTGVHKSMNKTIQREVKALVQAVIALRQVRTTSDMCVLSIATDNNLTDAISSFKAALARRVADL